MTKTININFNLNVFKWALSQTFAYPILVILGLIMAFAVLTNTYFLSILFCGLVALVFYLFGSDRDGQNQFSYYLSFIIFLIDSKILLKKDFLTTSKAYYNKCVVTASYAYTMANINHSEPLESDINRFIGTATNIAFIYSLNASLEVLTVEDLNPLLFAMKQTSKDYSQLYLDFAMDLQDLARSKDLKTIKTTFTLATEIERSKDLKPVLKALENDLNHIKNQNSNISIS